LSPFVHSHDVRETNRTTARDGVTVQNNAPAEKKETVVIDPKGDRDELITCSDRGTITECRI